MAQGDAFTTGQDVTVAASTKFQADVRPATGTSIRVSSAGLGMSDTSYSGSDVYLRAYNFVNSAYLDVTGSIPVAEKNASQPSTKNTDMSIFLDNNLGFKVELNNKGSNSETGRYWITGVQIK